MNKQLDTAVLLSSCDLSRCSIENITNNLKKSEWDGKLSNAVHCFSILIIGKITFCKPKRWHFGGFNVVFALFHMTIMVYLR